MTIHLATSAELARVVHEGLRVPVRFVSDNWMMGPWPSERDEIASARCDFWTLQGRERTKGLAEFRNLMRAIESNERIIVWMSRLGSDTLAFWAFCAWRLQVFHVQPNMGLIVLGGPTETEDPLGVDPGFIRSTPDDARQAVETEKTLSLTHARNITRLWRWISGHAPILSSKINDTTPDRQRLKKFGAHQAAFLPRLGERGLLLSQIDELIFKCISKRGSTPVDVIVHSGKTGEELRQWMAITGDIFIAKRLEQWATHGGNNAALEREPHRADRVMLAARYRLSDTGRKILRNGLGEIGQGVPLPIWGVMAYDVKSPWVVVENEAQGIRVQKLPKRRAP